MSPLGACLTLSPGRRALPSGGGKGQHLKCVLGGDRSKVESYFWLLQGTGLGQSMGSGVGF